MLSTEHATERPQHQRVCFDETLEDILDPSIASKGVEDLPMSMEA